MSKSRVRTSIHRRKSLRFGGFVVDMTEDVVTRNGQPIPVSGQPLAILKMLLQHPNRIVTRQELKENIWPRATRIDTTRRLNTAVRALRSALDDSADQPRWIETVRGHGYRFVGRIRKPVSEMALCTRFVSTAALMLLAALLPASKFAIESEPTGPDNLAPYLTALAVAENPDPSVRDALADFVANNPRYRPAAELQARFAADDWRSDPTAERLEIAESTTLAAIRRVGETPMLLNLLGELRWDGFGDRFGATQALTESLALMPEQAGPHRTLAWMALTAGDDEKARHHLQTLMADFDLTPADKADAGWLWLRLGEPQLARSLCQDFGSGPASRNLLSCQHTARARLGDIDGALKAAMELMELIDAPATLADSIKASNVKEAYQRFLTWRIEAFQPRSHFQRAQLLADAGQLGEAEAALRASVAADELHLKKLASTLEFAPIRDTAGYRAALSWVGS